MKQKLLAFFLASLPTVTQIAPVLAQQQQQTAALSPDTPVNLPGLYYDPDPGPSPTFRQLTTAEQAGYVEIPPLPNGVQLPYQIDRAWPQGATPDQILKFGDLQQNPVTASFTKLTLRDISARQGTDIAGVPIGDVPLVYGLTVDEVDNLYTKLNNGEKITVDDAAPAIQAALGVLYDPSQAGKQLQQAALTTGEKVLITRLSKIPAFKGIPLQDLARGNWEGVISKAEQIQLAGIGKKIGPTLKKLPVNQIVPLVGDAINGNWQQVRKRAQAYILAKGTNVAVKEVIKAVPELKNLPLGAVPDLVNQPIEQTLPKIADLAIEEIPGAEDKLVNSVPGLSDIPVNKLPFDLAFSFLAGDVFARFDIAYSGVEGPEEPSVQHALSGGTEDQKFRPIKCTLGQTKNQRANNCPHFEMRKFISSPLAQVTGDDDIEGKQWVAGNSKGKNGQGVKGGKGLLKRVNGGWEPAGIHPFGTGSHTKFVLKNIKEYPNKPSTARLHLAIQVCVPAPLIGEQCTPHFFVIPTPFTVREGGLFLVASRRSLPAEIAKFRNRALTAAGLSQVYCDPNQIIASTGQSDTGTSGTKGDISDLQAQAEAEGVNIQPIDGSIGAPRLDGIPGQPGSNAAKSSVASASGQSTGTQVTKAQIVGKSAWGSETDVYNLILTSALESTGTQNQVDVAVAIMNRVVSPKHPNTITEVVFQPKQYEPNFGQSPVTSKEEAISRIARKTRSVQSAISTYETIEKALNDPNAIAASQAFLKGATDFRGQDWLHIRQPGDPYRGNVGANFYFQESQDPAIAAATLGVLGVESTAVDPNSIYASASGQSIPCKPSAITSNPNGQLGPFVQGDGITTGQFGLPTEHPVSSPYGSRPLGFHRGIDYATPMGSEIRASDGGVVKDVEVNCPQQGHLESECGDKYGNLVFIEHSNGYVTVYGHLSTTNVKIGDPVKKGQVIALSGNSGRTTGPHLHFEIRDPSNRRLNPANYLN